MAIGRGVALFLAAMAVAGLAQAQQRKPAPADAQVYFIYPKNGDVVQGGKLWVRMGLRNMGIAPAGVAKEDTGHHHLLLDVDSCRRSTSRSRTTSTISISAAARPRRASRVWRRGRTRCS